MAEAVKDVHLNARISTAVGFLEDISEQNWNEADLRRYLLGNRGLSNDEVKEAFRIHRSKSNKKASRKSRPSSADKIMVDNIKRPDASRRSRTSSRENIDLKEEKISILPFPADRPGRLTEQMKKVATSNSSYLESSRKVDGERLINDFLVREKGYCSVLECLNDEYLQGLLWQAKQGNFCLAYEDIQKMFSKIPQLLNFHQSFNKDLMLGLNIGRLFIRRLRFFKGYGEYIKDVASIIDMLGEHIFDKKLQKCFESIRRRSRLSKNDLADLLLTPIARIWDYKIFLDSLCELADETQRVEYQFFGKAARRIGRVASYVDKYRHGIINNSEMIRAQRYLGQQCLILAVADRRIVRRGVITRRTTGWTARNKKYHFFLFTDVLLWTSKNGTLRNIVKLSRCKVLPSNAKTAWNRKFRILINMNPKTKEEKKVLLLECKTRKQRDTWYRSLDDTINSANDGEVEASPIDEIHCTMENDSEDEELSKKAALVDDSSWSGKRKSSRGNASEDWTAQSTGLTNTPYHDRYESHNFVVQKLQEFEPMDDTESQSSDYDHSFFEKFGEHGGVKSTSLISPHQKSSPAVFENEVPISRRGVRDAGNPKNRTTQSPSICIIKRNNTEPMFKSDDEVDIKRSSSFTVRLSDGMISPDANFVISLSGLQDGVYI